jgi:hypothetical protein
MRSASHPPVLYIVNSNEAFLFGSNGRVDSGFFQSRTGTSASGIHAFGTLDPEDVNVNDSSGVANFVSPNVNVSDDNNSKGTLGPGQMQSFTFSVDSTGLVHLPSGCTISATSTTCQTIIYVISPTKAVVMDTSGATNPSIQVAD